MWCIFKDFNSEGVSITESVFIILYLEYMLNSQLSTLSWKYEPKNGIQFPHLHSSHVSKNVGVQFQFGFKLNCILLYILTKMYFTFVVAFLIRNL